MGKARFLTKFWIIATYSLVMLLAGCGGSGGKSTETIPPAAEVKIYTGETNQAALDQSNARTIAEGSFWGGLLTYGTTYSISAIFVQPLDTHRVSLLNHLYKSTATLVQALTDIPANSIPRAAGAMTSLSINEIGPDGGTITGTISINDETGDFTGSVTFTNYIDGYAVSNGTKQIHGNRDKESQYVNYLDIELDDFSVTFDTDTMKISGTISRVFLAQYLESVFIDLYAREENTNSIYWYNNYIMETTSYTDYSEISIKGRYYDPDYGYVDLSTESPMILQNDGDTFSGGVFIITGSPGSAGGNTKARYSVATDYLEIDADGNGSFEGNQGISGESGNSGSSGSSGSSGNTGGSGTPSGLNVTIISPEHNITIYKGQSVNFQSTVSGGIGPYTFLWNFGGSGIEYRTDQNPGSLTFYSSGSYLVTFTATDSSGTSKRASVLVNVMNDPSLVVGIAWPPGNITIYTGQGVNFQGYTTGGLEPFSYLWTFGGAAPDSTVMNPGYIYFSSPGRYTVNFQVSDSNNQVSGASIIVTVMNPPFEASITSPDGNITISEGQSVNFQGWVTGGQSPYTYQWTFDGSIPNSTMQNPGNTIFYTPGSYTITFQVTDAAASTLSRSVNVIVQALPVESDIESPAVNVTITRGQSVNFQGSVMSGAAPFTYLWSFDGAGPNSTIEDPGDVTFNDPGYYNVTLIVTDSQGRINSSSVVVIVRDTISTMPQKSVAYQIDVAHTGHAVFDQTLTFPDTPTWSVTLGEMMSYPLIANGKVFVINTINTSTGYTSELYALDKATGGVIWGPVSVSGGTYFKRASHAYDNGKVFVVNYDGLLQSFDAATGQPGWSTVLPGQYGFTAPPTAANGIVYVGGAGILYALNERNGQLLWTERVLCGDESSPTVTDDGVFVSYPEQVYKFDPFTGITLWHYNGGGSGGGGDTSVYTNGLLYVRDWSHSPQGFIFNATTGDIVGRFGLDIFNLTYIPAIATQTGFFMIGGTLQGIDLTSNQVLWSFAGDGSLVTVPIVIDNVVIVGSSSGNVYALNGATGSQMWTGYAGSTIIMSSYYRPITGFAAGEGYLVVPAGNVLTAWHIAGP